ncbi:hypothetical protein MKY34_03975 [Sporosarcina sp. FSL K6-1522]|uniref:hypothetical protein n=1 Tax=Sporosarcina sp. FSL K6-1522 TaxID=2921554 RepID=UPI003159D602
MNRFCKFILLSLLLFVFTDIGTVNAEEGFAVPIEDRERLLNLGFSNEELDIMDEEIYNLNKEIVGEIVASDTKYFKIIEVLEDDVSTLNGNTDNAQLSELQQVIELDKETYFKEIEYDRLDNSLITPFGYIPGKTTTSYRTLNTFISKIQEGKKYRIHTSTQWHKMPAHRKIDVIGTSINSAFWAPVPKSQQGQQAWTTGNSCPPITSSRTQSYNSSSSSWKHGPSGYTLSIDLPNNVIKNTVCGSSTVKSLLSFAYFDVTRLANTKQLDAYGKYLHQETSVQINPSITFAPASFGVAGSQATKFTSTTNHARLTY